MDPITLTALEFDGLRGLIGESLRSSLGREALRALLPETDPARIGILRERAREALAYTKEVRIPSPGEVEDPAEILDLLEPEGALVEPVRFAKLASFLRIALAFRDEIAAVRTRYPRMWDVAGSIPSLRPLLGDLASRVDPEGHVEDQASAELARIRKQLAGLEGRLQRLMQSMLERQTVRESIQDAFVTVRNGRFVIPVKVEARRSVPGIIHGASSTGATVFLEPMEAVDPNNELVTLRDEEEAEIRKILLDLGARVRGLLPELRSLRRVVGEADLLGACASFAERFSCQPAENGEGILLEDARHPVLQAALEQRGEKIVPIRLEMPEGSRIMVLSGPNTGGKTATLKTVGLLALMSQSGLLVPATRAVLPIFRRVLADVGDRQSITDNLSTFSARMLRVAEMSGSLDSPSLVLLDEVGGGTDPEEEGVLAVAIVDHFRRRGASVLATTHHIALKAWAEATGGASNASMEFDERALRPTYRVLAGLAGRSGGIEMAGKLGLPEEILEAARSQLSDSHLRADQYLTRLREMVDDRERALDEAVVARDRARRERQEAMERALEEERNLRESYQSAVREALERIGEAGEAVVNKIRERSVSLQMRAEAKRAAHDAAEKVEKEIAPPEPRHLPAAAGTSGVAGGGGALEEGSRVRIRSMGAAGTLEKMDRKRGRADVLVRGMRMTVKLSECEPEGGGPKGSGGPPRLPQRVSVESARAMDRPAEINLIGKTVDEGTGLLEKFLDDTVLSGHREVRIVHGHGTGRLRAAVAEFLRGHPLVESYRPAGAGGGGTGATLAILKE